MAPAILSLEAAVANSTTLPAQQRSREDEIVLWDLPRCDEWKALRSALPGSQDCYAKDYPEDTTQAPSEDTDHLSDEAAESIINDIPSTPEMPMRELMPPSFDSFGANFFNQSWMLGNVCSPESSTSSSGQQASCEGRWDHIWQSQQASCEGRWDHIWQSQQAVAYNDQESWASNPMFSTVLVPVAYMIPPNEPQSDFCRGQPAATVMQSESRLAASAEGNHDDGASNAECREGSSIPRRWKRGKRGGVKHKRGGSGTCSSALQGA
eukprot:gnl/TRDRNA2_/TRDRNA2_82660_c0_seq1.p1 gnl/TRDRNA2_/TRDRNA2_82660_c0~~gnl/TRDRNA2_/TRDRNA2_82660_c0_seq1.p1  ORF type:complete len:298 (+),score=51.49 gnl/TRDRNA2_/TRDRNA2_82660_c0_seq1:99-896(+)